MSFHKKETEKIELVARPGRIQNGREYELRVSSNDGKHADVEVQARLNFVGFSQFAVQESVVIRFSGEMQNLACGKSNNVANNCSVKFCLHFVQKCYAVNSSKKHGFGIYTLFTRRKLSWNKKGWNSGLIFGLRQ